MFSKLCNPLNFNHTQRSKSSVKYIVVHYTAGKNDTARNNLEYFHREKVGASAHYFVDEKEVCNSVPWYNVAWHCGGNRTGQGGSVYGQCTNYNSIGVEMCSRVDAAGAYYFADETISNCATFVAQLMKEYKIPIDRVVRHYDVTGKICPAPFIDERTWKAFKNLVMRKYNNESGEWSMETTKYFEKLEEIPVGELRNTVATFVENDIIRGNGSGLHLSEDMVRVMVFCKRYMDSVIPG